MQFAQNSGIDDKEMEKELRQIFVAEATDLLEIMETQILRLEAAPDDERVISEIFRAAHTIKGSGLSVGYAELGKFCHILETLLDKIRKKSVSPVGFAADALFAGLDMLKRAITALQTNCYSTGFETIGNSDKETVLKNLELAAQGQAGDIPQPTAKSQNSSLKNLANILNETELLETYEDKELYQHATLEAKAFTPSSADYLLFSFFIEQSFSLRDIEGLSKHILTAFRSHPRWDAVDRVCIAKRIGLSAQLEVLDSFCVDELLRNAVFPGYRCFVSNNSSLFKVPKFHFRIYKDITKVIRNYAKKDFPIQRSLKRIFSQGYLSGLCIPLRIFDSQQGFLFLNSRTDGYFSARGSEDITLLSSAAALAQQYLALKTSPLSPRFESYLSVNSLREQGEHSQVDFALPHALFSAITLKDEMQRCLAATLLPGQKSYNLRIKDLAPHINLWVAG